MNYRRMQKEAQEISDLWRPSETNLPSLHCVDWEIEALERLVICCRSHSSPEAAFGLEHIFRLPESYSLI